MIILAPFEAFEYYEKRKESVDPYGGAFIRRCREKAREYDKNDSGLRDLFLEVLMGCVPRQYWPQVFGGINISGLSPIIPGRKNKTEKPKKRELRKKALPEGRPEQLTLL